MKMVACRTIKRALPSSQSYSLLLAELMPLREPDSEMDEGAVCLTRPPSSPSNSWSSAETAPLPVDSPGGGDDARRPKRCKISREQLSVLINSFEEEPLPNFDQRQALAKMLGMTPRSVQIWFQNRRQRLKPMQPKASSPGGMSPGGMRLGSGGFGSGQTPQQHLGMPGLAAAAGLCGGGGGQAFEQLMLHSAMSQLTNACAGAMSQLTNACAHAGAAANLQSHTGLSRPPSAAGQPQCGTSGAAPAGGFARSSSYGDELEPFAATKALLGAGYQAGQAGSSTSLAALAARSPSMQPANTPHAPCMTGMPGHHGGKVHPNIMPHAADSSCGGYPLDASLITPTTAQAMEGPGSTAIKSEKADGLLLLLACADNNAAPLTA